MDDGWNGWVTVWEKEGDGWMGAREWSARHAQNRDKR